MQQNGTLVVSESMRLGEAENWTEIQQIVLDGEIIYGLKEDGTVVTTFDDLPGCEEWNDIAEIRVSSFCYAVVGLKKDGTVVAEYMKWGVQA